MKKCAKCGSLVDELDSVCPVRSDRCPIFLEPSEASPSATIALTAEQVQALLPAANRTRRAPEAVEAAPAPPEVNRAALLGRNLGFLAIVPFFPIGLVALLVSAIALMRADRFPAAPERGKALFGLVAGAVFGGTWMVLSLWVLRDYLLG